MTEHRVGSLGRASRRKRLRFRSPGWAVTVLLLVVWFLLSPAQPVASRLALAPSPNPRFGLVFVDGVTPDSNQPYANPQARYDQAKTSGAAFTRWPMYWHLIETSRNNMDFSSQDQVADLDIRNGLEVDAILMGTPSWGGVTTSALKPPVPFGVGPHLPDQPSGGLSRSGAGAAFMAGSAGAVPLGLDQPPFLPNGSINTENRWANYVYTTVKRYMPGGELAQQKGWPQGRGIRYWEMWNEPDFTWPGANGQEVPVFWEGGVQNYYRLLKVGYLAAKAADPQSTVVMGGLQYWSDQAFFTKVLDQIMGDPDARSKNYFFDVVPFHLYINPYNILNVGQWANAEMSKRGIGKSVWVNETNLPVYDDANTRDGVFCPGWQGTQDEQASFVIQASALAMAAWVDKVFLFQLYDDNVAYRENFGLVRNDNTIRPSYTAYQVAATYMSNPASIRRTLVDDVESISFISPGYGKVTVLWNNGTTQKTVNLVSSTPKAQLVDKVGNASWVDAVGNFFAVTLPPKAKYNIPGCTNRPSDQPGSPLILVEHINADLSSKVNALPEITSQSTFPVSWSRLDTVGGTILYDIQYRVGKDGTWQDWLTNVAQTASNFGPAQGGKTYYFRSHARMGEMVEPYPEGDGDAFTTVKLFLNGSIVDNRGWPVSQATVEASTPGLSTVTTTTDGKGIYSLELPANATYQVAISRQGFGNLPPKSIGVTTSIDYDFALPPKNDAVQNGGFEGGMAGWITSGTVVTQTFRHTGGWGTTISKSGTFSQTLTIPGSQSQTALSFFYRTPAPGTLDRLEVQVVGNKTVSFVFPLSQNTWQQGWVDTSGLQGKAEVLFRFTGQGDIWLDEVALGSSPYRIFLPQVDQNR